MLSLFGSHDLAEGYNLINKFKLYDCDIEQELIDCFGSLTLNELLDRNPDICAIVYENVLRLVSEWVEEYLPDHLGMMDDVFVHSNYMASSFDYSSDFVQKFLDFKQDYQNLDFNHIGVNDTVDEFIKAIGAII